MTDALPADVVGIINAYKSLTLSITVAVGEGDPGGPYWEDAVRWLHGRAETAEAEIERLTAAAHEDAAEIKLLRGLLREARATALEDAAVACEKTGGPQDADCAVSEVASQVCAKNDEVCQVCPTCIRQLSEAKSESAALKYSLHAQAEQIATLQAQFREARATALENAAKELAKNPYDASWGFTAPLTTFQAWLRARAAAARQEPTP